MTSTLSNFLSATELDTVQKLASTLPPLEQAEKAQIRNIIEQWHEPQAVANLLMYPSLIPEDLRFNTLLRAIKEQTSYLALAAIVGLQEQVNWWSDAERATLVEQLQSITFGAPDPLASRASVTLLDYTRLQDVDKTIFLLGAPREIVQYHSLLTLLRLLSVEETRRRVSATFEAERLTKSGYDYAMAHIDTLSSEDSPLFSYIPNLQDFTAT